MSDAIIMLSDRRVRLAGQSKHLGVRMRGRDDHYPRDPTWVDARCMHDAEGTHALDIGGHFARRRLFFQRENRWCPWARWAQ